MILTFTGIRNTNFGWCRKQWFAFLFFPTLNLSFSAVCWRWTRLACLKTLFLTWHRLDLYWDGYWDLLGSVFRYDVRDKQETKCRDARCHFSTSMSTWNHITLMKIWTFVKNFDKYAMYRILILCKIRITYRSCSISPWAGKSQKQRGYFIETNSFPYPVHLMGNWKCKVYIKRWNIDT